MGADEVAELKARSRAVWDTGDYGPTSRQLEPASERLVEALGIGPGQDVLDVAAGHGNCAVAAARRGAAVTATDFAPGMVRIGLSRTGDLGLKVTWREADAADLPFAEASFDRVTSVFGAIFAPEQERTAAEMARVTRPGGVVGLTAWPPGGYPARVIATIRAYGPPPPPGVPDPLDWGRADRAVQLLGSAGCRVRVRRRTLTFGFPSWEAWRAGLEAHGMAVTARQRMAPDRYEALLDDLRAVAEEYNRGRDGAVACPAGYLEILATRP